MKRIAGWTLALALLALAAAAANTGVAKPPAQATASANPEFLHAADEVLAQMSQILDLPIKQPLKKSLRSKQEIRDYIIREEKDDKSDTQQYADTKALEAFGLIPKNFPLDSFMLDVLTDQIAGLYDPKAKEFYIADWIKPDQQREVMSHELTHALEDQSFDVDPWIKAARPNDDAELARDSVSEGTAMAAMVDYSLRDSQMGVRDLPDVAPLMRLGVTGEWANDPILAKAPPYIRDELFFPYLAGASFSQQFLKAHTGWADLKLLFENPPVSTQQILHPQLYLNGVKPQKVTLPDWKGVVPADWNLLEENVQGEFGLDEILKQFLGQDRADSLSPAWTGDRYALFEDAKTKELHLIFRLELDTVDHAARFCGQYSEALELKYKNRTQLFRQPNYFQFQSDTGGVFLRCVGTTCLVVENSSRGTYDKITAALGWPAAPGPPATQPPQSIAQLAAPKRVHRAGGPSLL